MYLKIKTFLVLGLLILAGSISAQKDIAGLSELGPDKLVKKATGYDHLDHFTNFQTYGMLEGVQRPEIKKVGILSIYVNDILQREVSGGKGIAESLTGAGSDQVVDKLYAKALPGLQEAFASQGMELLTPAQYCTSEELEYAYRSFEVEFGGGSNLAGKIAEKMSGEKTAVASTPEEYKLHEAAGILMVDRKLAWGVGELCEALSLDAMITIEITTRLEGSNVFIDRIAISMHAPNFSSFDPEAKYNTVYKEPWKGVLLAGIAISTPLELAKIKKKSFKEFNDEGTTELFAKLGTLLLGYEDACLDYAFQTDDAMPIKKIRKQYGGQ